MAETYPFIIHRNFLNVVIGGTPYTLDSSHQGFDACVEAVKAGDWNKVKTLVSKEKMINATGEGLVTFAKGQVYFKGEPVHSTLTVHMLRLMDEGKNIKPMIKFLENLMSNPSVTAVTELYSFLEKGNLPLTEDGHFLAYKRIRGNWKDIHSGTVDHSIGAKPSMDRDQVDWNRNNTCSTGFHFCSFRYLSSFASSSPNSDRIVVVKINPRDVVSIPADYNDTKGRACTYEVFAEIVGDDKLTVPAFDSSLVVTTRTKAKAKKRSRVKVEGKTPADTKRKRSRVKTAKKEAVKEISRKSRAKKKTPGAVSAGPARDANGRFISNSAKKARSRKR